MAVGFPRPLIVGLTVMFEVIAITAVALRFWAQRLLKHKFFAHDMWIVIGFVKFKRFERSGGLGQHSIELYATPWKIVAFQRVSIDH
ncbi:hypothetical protein J7T55_002538 [Diaporthe amygdali]|uniref:uncharacterized protein n=1 Tax=Phomopsis amygdali TaxID=1214568 RepID=UPI0022FE40D6|nr:uncharacterized protein J7T55_002538 [Diaporthe amygdali]KAJ0122027.1 hypothetical protein J7T55_002538 [Diaporthe amygdali]